MTYLRQSKTNLTSGYGRPEVRFWRSINKRGSVYKNLGRCWEWIRGKSSGYGQISIKNCPNSAHRFSWELHYGKIPEGFWVLHRCDNRLCVNPEHLFLGSSADNIHDMMDKGRAKINGELNGVAKLTDEKVKEIRKLYQWRSSRYGSYGLARMFGVCQFTIMQIISGKRWKHLLDTSAR